MQLLYKKTGEAFAFAASATMPTGKVAVPMIAAIGIVRVILRKRMKIE